MGHMDCDQEPVEVQLGFLETPENEIFLTPEYFPSKAGGKPVSLPRKGCFWVANLSNIKVMRDVIVHRGITSIALLTGLVKSRGLAFNVTAGVS